jgi:peptidylprolyl isomerase
MVLSRHLNLILTAKMRFILIYKGVNMKTILSFFTVAIYFCYSFFSLHALENNMEKFPVVEVETNYGTFEVTLRPDIAPKASENFLTHAKNGYYNQGIFHRVIKGFMIQGGDPEGTGRGGKSIWTTPFEDEVSDDVKFDKVGLLAMANAGPKTNGSQFFITTSKPSWLNKKHTIFGEVTKGYDVVQKIDAAPTKQDRPIEEVKIIRMTVKNS